MMRTRRYSKEVVKIMAWRMMEREGRLKRGLGGLEEEKGEDEEEEEEDGGKLEEAGLLLSE